MCWQKSRAVKVLYVGTPFCRFSSLVFLPVARSCGLCMGVFPFATSDLVAPEIYYSKCADKWAEVL